MKCFLGISNFLEEISSFSYSIVFLYFFALIAEEGFLISPCYSLEFCSRCLHLSFSPLLFASLLFIAICKPCNITVIQVYAPASNAEETEVEWFYEDLQDLLEVTPKKDVLFIIGDWNARGGSQETPGVTGKFGLGIRNEAGQRLIGFCQENALVIANTFFQQHRRRLHMDITRWSTPKSD